MINLKYKEKDIPRWLPEEIRKVAIDKLTLLEERIKNKDYEKEEKTTLKSRLTHLNEFIEEINFAFQLVVDDRMKEVWEKLYKINPQKTLIFFPNSITLNYSLYRIFDPRNKLGEEIKPIKKNLFDVKPKISILEEALNKCNDLSKFMDQLHTMYTTEFDFEEFNKDSLIGESEHDDFMEKIHSYSGRIEQVLLYHKKNLKKFEAQSFLDTPISRKNNTDNAEAILWAKRLKSLFLSFYKKPLNKEIGTIISVLFGDDEKRFYDADYIAKITKDAQKNFFDLRKMEDSH